MTGSYEITSPWDVKNAVTASGDYRLQNAGSRNIYLHEGSGTVPTAASAVIYFGGKDSGAGLRVTLSATGSRKFDARTRGAFGNGWRVRREILATGSLAYIVDEKERLIVVGGGPNTGATLSTALSNVPGFTLTTAYVGGGSATSRISVNPREFTFAGGSDGGPSDLSQRWIIPPGLFGRPPGDVPYKRGSDPLWAWTTGQGEPVIMNVVKSS